MTDREMLEFAAKATGIELRWHQDGTAFSDTRCDGYWGVWNPLADDGDALRLAVKLSMHLALFDGAQETRALADGDEWECEGWEEGKEAATRRAIVRAAAEISKAIG